MSNRTGEPVQIGDIIPQAATYWSADTSKDYQLKLAEVEKLRLNPFLARMNDSAYKMLGELPENVVSAYIESIAYDLAMKADNWQGALDATVAGVVRNFGDKLNTKELVTCFDLFIQGQLLFGSEPYIVKGYIALSLKTFSDVLNVYLSNRTAALNKLVRAENDAELYRPLNDAEATERLIRVKAKQYTETINDAINGKLIRFRLAINPISGKYMSFELLQVLAELITLTRDDFERALNKVKEDAENKLLEISEQIEATNKEILAALDVELNEGRINEKQLEKAKVALAEVTTERHKNNVLEENDDTYKEQARVMLINEFAPKVNEDNLKDRIYNILKKNL
ncbi:MAG: hypothetical protein KDD49_03935 [Bacteroidetes bacterium]|nr:hypothetical protein [Bacteroidota bacterium]